MAGLRRKGSTGFSGDEGATRGYQTFMEDMEYLSTEWQLDAECSRLPPENFFYDGAASRPLLEEGVKACISCAAKDSCLENADLADRYWGVRGGLLPEALTSGVIPATRAGKLIHDPEKMPDKSCGRGHKESWKWKPGTARWYCGKCDSDRKAAIRNGEKLPRVLSKQDQYCSLGHTEFRQRSDGRGGKRWECVLCRREALRRYKASKKPAKMDA